MQLQSEVRPTVNRMPMEGYSLQTGGSARRRVIKPLFKQAPTNVFPTQNEYRVSGVPGHTHNSSAVVSVLVDLSRTRGYDEKVDESWQHTPAGAANDYAEPLEFKADMPGDSEVIDDEDERFDRALERGIGEIALRPENCHHEIREPVRSISEIRTLVSPDDRLQTLTYVEEVGGFVVPKDRTQAGRTQTVPYISDYPDVNIDLLGPTDLSQADQTGAGLYTNDAAKTPVRIVADEANSTGMVVLHDGLNAVGVLQDNTDWFGIVPFRWDPKELTYISEPFDVSLRSVILVTQAPLANAPSQVLNIRFPAIKLTRAEHGYCFLISPHTNATQAIRGANRANALQFRPRIPIEVLDVAGTIGAQYHWELGCAYRVKVGGEFAIPGPSVDVTNYDYLQLLNRQMPCGVLGRYDKQVGDDAAANASWHNAVTPLPAKLYGEWFNFVRELQAHPRNSKPGAVFEGYTRNVEVTRCMGSTDYSNFQALTNDFTDGKQLIPAALQTLGKAQTETGWKTVTTAEVQFEESNVEKVFVESAVVPLKFRVHPETFDVATPGLITDPESFWYWKKRILGNYDEDEMIQTWNMPNLGDPLHGMAIHYNLTLPKSKEWFSLRSNFKDMYIKGSAFQNEAAAEFQEKLIMMPALMEFYADDKTIDFTYNVGLDAAGNEDFDLSSITPKARETSTRFYIVGDVSFTPAGANTKIGLRADVGQIFAQTHSVRDTTLDVEENLDVINVRLPTDKRSQVGANAEFPFSLHGFGVGNVFEVVHQTTGMYTDYRLPHLFSTGNNDCLIISGLHFSFAENRTFFVGMNKFGTQAVPEAAATRKSFYFHTRDCETIICRRGNTTTHTVCTKINRIFEAPPQPANLAAFVKNLKISNHTDLIAFCHLGPQYQDLFIGDPTTDDNSLQTFAVSRFDPLLRESLEIGPVFQGKRRISQHLCAPILNPNMRIGCTAPLNFETGHLPPELRDFRLELRDVDFSFLPGVCSLQNLMLYEFNGGNQIVAAQDNLLHLPQFREQSAMVEADGNFDFEMFSPFGMPSFIAMFCRDTDRSRDHLSQPIIKQLSIMCTTTMKKSNTILEADVHELYHITQRNVNQRARYNRFIFNKRQVVLMSAEDIGMMGLTASEYQSEKRARFRFQGTVDQIGRVNAVLVYNNRGLYVQGKHMSVVRLGSQPM